MLESPKNDAKEDEAEIIKTQETGNKWGQIMEELKMDPSLLLRILPDSQEDDSKVKKRLRLKIMQNRRTGFDLRNEKKH